VKALNAYDIDIYGLQNKQYEFEFESGKSFFEALEQEMIEDGDVKAIVLLNKSVTMVVLDFHISGTVELVCDRSLDIFDEPIDLKERLILKFGDHNEPLTDEIELIKTDTQRVNVARHIFEFIALSLPMKKLHPRFRDEHETDDEILIYSSSENKNKEENKVIDPRWAALNQLKKDN
jgi:uncharacterized metal-binding protein YceD (DUF177 family)